MAVAITYAVNVRLPNGQYVTLTLTAINETAAASAAVAVNQYLLTPASQSYPVPQLERS